MTVVTFMAGVALLGLLAFDVTSTVLSPTSGPGPLTRGIGHVVWHGLGGRLSSPTSRWWLPLGPGALSATIVAWVALLVGGWWLVVLSTGPMTVTATQSPASALERLYFVVSAMSTLGLGDVVPLASGGRVVAVTAAVTGLGLVTLAVAYALPVLTAVTERRVLASTISAVGTSVSSIADALADADGTEQFLGEVGGSVRALAQRHRAYPILHFFHSVDRRAALAPSLAALDEAVGLVAGRGADQRPSSLALRRFRGAVDDLLVVTDVHLQRRAVAVPPSSGDVFDGVPCLHEPDDHRRRLHALVADDGWSWDRHVCATETGATSPD